MNEFHTIHVWVFTLSCPMSDRLTQSVCSLQSINDKSKATILWMIKIIDALLNNLFVLWHQDFHNFLQKQLPRAVVHDLYYSTRAAEHPVLGRYSAVVALIKRCLWDNPLEASVQVLLYKKNDLFMGQKEYTVVPRIVSSLEYFTPLNIFGSKNFLMINSCLLWIVSSLEHLSHFGYLVRTSALA